MINKRTNDENSHMNCWSERPRREQGENKLPTTTKQSQSVMWCFGQRGSWQVPGPHRGSIWATVRQMVSGTRCPYVNLCGCVLVRGAAPHMGR